MEVIRITREDGRLVTLSNLTTMYKVGQLDDTGVPYRHRLLESDVSDDPIMFIYYSEIGKCVEIAEDPKSKEAENLLMWGNKEGYQGHKWKAGGKKLKKEYRKK